MISPIYHVTSQGIHGAVFVDDKNHEQDTSHVYLIIIFISPLEIGVTHIEVPLNFHFIKLSS